MNNILKTIGLAITLALVSIAATAQVDTDAAIAARESVITQLEGGFTHEEIINSLTPGISRAEATIFCLVSGGEENREAFILAGIDGADSYSEARSVAVAVMATVGLSSPEVAIAQRKLTEYEKLMAQPSTYQDNYSPTGVGTSPDV
jgi:hypothetical protein